MQAIRTFLFLGVLLSLMYACIEPFTPDIGEGKNYLVMHGTVTDEEGYHYVEISATSSFSDREFSPLNNCEARIIDRTGNIFTMENIADGKYRTWIDQQYLQPGNSFKLQVINGGKTYESEYDSLLSCPEIDNIYYDEVYIVPDDPSTEPEIGIQFYIDYNATGDHANNYRWEAIETWEYKSKERIFIIYNGIEFDEDEDEYQLNIRFLNINFEEDRRIMDSLHTCWKTSKASGIYTYTSRQKNDKVVAGLPLFLITNKEDRLTIKYSILVKQLALSDIAFEYWNQLQFQSQETGGLYETQPYQLKGNIKCIDDEEEIVIGLFSASSVKTKRFTTLIHMNRNEYYCHDIVEGWDNVLTYLWGGVIGQPPSSNEKLPRLPLFLNPFLSASGELRIDTFSLIDQKCIDCRLMGGTIIKPDFW